MGATDALVVLELAEEELEEHRPLVPPVPEELCVVRRDDDGAAVHVRAQVLDLLLAVEHEVARVLGRAQVGLVRVVQALVVHRAVGDRVVLDAGERADARRVDVRLDVVERQIEADVAVEVAVARVARVALLRAPDLLAALDVATERRDARAAVDGRVHAVERPRLGEEDAVRVDEEEADALFAHQLVDARHVAAFAQPHPLRAPAEEPLVDARRGVDLRAERSPVAVEQAERRGASRCR